MRRFPAILLLALFGLSPIVPLTAEPESKLPACCRRGGAHHCASDEQAAAGALIQGQCPAYPNGGAAPAHAKGTGAPPGQTLFAQLTAQAAARAQAKAFRKTSFSRARQKRGPPARLS